MKFEIDKKLWLLKVDGEPKYRLTELEAKILWILIKYPNQTFSAKGLAKRIGSTEDSVINSIPKMKKDYSLVKEHIRTIWGEGYEWLEREEKVN